MIKELLEDYENLLYKKFIIGIEGLDALEFEFKPINFPHLVGLHKLDDLPVIQKFKNKNDKIYNAKKIYNDIRNNELTDVDLLKSSNIDMIKNSRWDYFNATTILRLVHNEEIIKFNPLKIRFKNGDTSKLEKIDYILYEHIKNSEEENLQFCIGFNERDKRNHPTTFFVEKSDIYIYNQESRYITSLCIKSKKSIEFKIYWNSVRYAMKKNSHYKWLLKQGSVNNFDINTLKKEDILTIKADDTVINNIMQHFELLRLDEIKMVYQPYIKEAVLWNNEKKRFILEYIDRQEDKNILPSVIEAILDIQYDN